MTRLAIYLALMALIPIAVIAAVVMFASGARAETVTCRTPGITDGDTIRCAGERVRIHGIDAPERHTPAGPAATRAMADLTRGQTVTCIGQGYRSYGRLVARCYVGVMDLACEMVRLGQARDWPRFSGGEYARCAHAP